MTEVKYVSTRVSIIGRGASCKGMSAVERSAYISRSTLHSDYYGQTFYPKYAEDLVYGEVLLPGHAPASFKDRAILWNSVEQQEKHARAQLCRSVNISMPNEWSYELSVEAVRKYIRRNFTGKGMCAEYAIHDSVNPKTHQRNLHCHILLTMRPLNQDGSWGERQTKVYKLDKAGNKIKNRNGKGWQCTTVKTTDWDAPDNARRWRRNLAEEINAVNERIGLTDVVWEWRSFKEQGMEEKPTIHLGEKASALENSGIPTERGEYNRDVRQFNALLRQEKLLLEQERLETENSIVAAAPKEDKQSPLLAFLSKVQKEKGMMSIPVIRSKYLLKVSNRQQMQEIERMERFVKERGIENFDQLDEMYDRMDNEWQHLLKEIRRIEVNREENKKLLKAYKEYVPYREIKRQGDTLSGLAKKKFDFTHKDDLAMYREKREIMFSLVGEGNKLKPKYWEKEVINGNEKIKKIQTQSTKLIRDLAYMEILLYTRRDMERLEHNKKSHQERQHCKIGRDR